MMDVLFYRDAVLEIILEGQHITREVYELRFNLFLRAANHYFSQKNTNSEVLEPFPHCFYDCSTKTRNYDELRACISSIPQLSKIDTNTTLPELTWHLLHWIFTNPLKIEVKTESPISEFETDVVREETKLMNIPYPSKECNRFEIIHPEGINSTKAFLKHKNGFGSFFAYHGSPGHNFHSIIHRGLRCSLNVRKAYGPGTYLTSYLDTAASYSKQYGQYSWNDSSLNKLNLTQNAACIKYCVAIVEVVKHPSIKIVNFESGSKAAAMDKPNFDDTSSNNHKYYVVNSDDLMRLKHLLVFY